MIPGEQAQERLKAFQVPDWRERRLTAIARLPEDLNRLFQTLLNDDQYVRMTLDRIAEEAYIQSLKRLDELGPGERQRIFEMLFPKLGRYIEGVWQLQKRLPYQVGWYRKAFRAPNAPHLTRLTWGLWLKRLARSLEGYEQDITWLAAWAPYLGRVWGASDALGLLFAAAIDAGGSAGQAVFDILLASARGEHEIGAMGRHVTRALLVASRPDGWEFVERLLIAAQGQEGLRQVILETIDEAHPEAFRRMLRLIVQHNLARFSACVRAVDVWFGFQWQAPNVREVNQALERVLGFLENPESRAAALAGDDDQAAYLALWTLAFEDITMTFDPASAMLSDERPERRFVATHLLTQFGITKVYEALLDVLEDPDLRVATCAFMALRDHQVSKRLQGSDLFERLERLLPRLKYKKQTFKPILFPWLELSIERSNVAGALIHCLGERSPKRLIPHLSQMSPYNRGVVVKLLGETKPWDAEIRETLFALVGDMSDQVRESAFRALADRDVSLEEALYLEGLLTRKPSDLRRFTLFLLLRQGDEAALASAGRLLESSDALQRAAGLELLRQMIEARRLADQCRARVEAYARERTQLTPAESNLLDAIHRREPEPATLDDALGLLEPAQRTRPTPPNAGKGIFSRFGRRPLVTEAAVACLKSLDDLIHEHRTVSVTLEGWRGTRELLLGNLQYAFPSPNGNLPIQEDVPRLPLRDVWETWWANRTDALRDTDGLELVRALGLTLHYYAGFGGSQDRQDPPWLKKALERLYQGVQPGDFRYAPIMEHILEWLIRLHPPAGAADFLLDAVEFTFALIPAEELAYVPQFPRDYRDVTWRERGRLLRWLGLARRFRDLCPSEWGETHHIRLWRLLRWMDEPGPPVPRHRPHLQEVLAAYQAGGATEADVLEQLLGARGRWDHIRFDELRTLSGRKPSPLMREYPFLQELVDRCRRRIVEVELGRGDLPTAASEPAMALRYAGGQKTLVRLLKALGQEEFTRGWSYDGRSKAAVFSHLIRATFPVEDDAPEDFAAQVEAAHIPSKRLIELAMYAPQWAGHVEHALGWPGLADGVWWFHAHTKDNQWHVEQEVRDAWAAEVSERTPLTAQDLMDGAVDVAWFNRVYAALGEERWTELDKAGIYASGRLGHARARLFADAMLGRVTREELVNRMMKKRYQDAVRALGLLPLADGEQRERDVLERYQAVQEFLRTSRQFGSMRQASEKLAARIALENLARTAGYPDPIRLQWAMEVHEAADLAQGPITTTVNEVMLTLSINDLGEPELAITKQGKPVKAIPAQVKKDPQVAALLERKREIDRQVSRIRLSLENAMCRGDAFTGEELQRLCAHPMLAPMLAQLVFVGDGIAGYPVEQGRALEFYDGMLSPVKSQAVLRIAHPYDLLKMGEWHKWQRECFVHERIQPFKQVFRELYVLTEAEQVDGAISRRYAGQQVNPRQALALLGQRGWVSRPEEGVRRTFHDEGISAWLEFPATAFTPAEVEGLALEGVSFTRRGEWKPLPLADIPPRVFSEVMRDLDLVVSVAHAGGVDPEASASTVEMRATLVRETCAWLKLGNVRVQDSHVLIEGRLGSYSVHLGSAVVHRQPGGALCIVPVHAQHRGRLFLPFADNDPKTAEVLSKVLLLAKDTEIKDPTILEQILTLH